ncbi:60S ribosomal protein [Suhomyces tanzawaensis NRRL Y-17324]|uniref:Large ribosomal subunit protein mL49 n=1 Tax=Suhomyces tanzawaensis NRRL Y-17324 TaxID=984487 RepID=A0A1E4SHP7_9ASCO|nr:60S ribosomal protein [Suhomyces tanzawaensis NRRL Y-17324]ODV79031.1 60S ribosomal protein [Suhomyces tanzawaensis NRRL Y-17324]
MRPSFVSLKSVRVPLPTPTIKPFEIPPLSSISYKNLPNTGFGIHNYSITKTKFKHWPVYLKIQNTKISTEVKRIQGDVVQFKNDLLALNPNLEITVNQNIGYVNIKGDVVNEIKKYFDENIESSI